MTRMLCGTTVILCATTAAAQPAGNGTTGASDVERNSDGTIDYGTRIWLLGDAALNVTDAKGVGSGGIAIRGPLLWFRLFVSTATDPEVTGASGDRAFGRSLLSPETGGRGVSTMVRVMYPTALQAEPETRWGGVLDLVAQDTRWEVGEMGSDGVSWGLNLGFSVTGEGGVGEDSKNQVLAYADLMPLMLRGLNRDFAKRLRLAALNENSDRVFYGMGIRAGFKVDHLLFTGQVSWFPTDPNIPGFSGAQAVLSIAIDGGIQLRWAKTKAEQTRDKKRDAIKKQARELREAKELDDLKKATDDAAKQ